jgi:hypothetical protein
VADDLTFHLTLSSNLLGSTTVVPQIQYMCFGYERKATIDYSSCLKMVQSRWGSQNPGLSAIALLTGSGPGPDAATIAGLELLRLDGLDVALTDGEDAILAMRAWIQLSWNR